MIYELDDREGVDADGLWLRLVGTFGVFLAGRELPPNEVGSRKARTLLAALAVRRAHFIDADDLAAALWPDRAPRRVRANLATLVSRLRSVLGRDAVVGDAGIYQLGPAVKVDIFAASDLVQRAERELTGNSARAYAAARQAVRLVGNEGVLVEYRDAPWIEPVRALPSGLARRARLTLAWAALLLGDATTARTAADWAIAADALDEPAYRALMCAYAAAGEPVRALAAYERLRVALADEVGVDPAPATHEVYVGILRNRVPDPGEVLVWA